MGFSKTLYPIVKALKREVQNQRHNIRLKNSRIILNRSVNNHKSSKTNIFNIINMIKQKKYVNYKKIIKNIDKK